MKPQYEATKQRILEQAEALQAVCGLTWVTVEHRFIEAFKDDDDPATIAETQSYWQYRASVVRWFLPAAIRLTDKELKAVIIHEIVHIILCPMESHVTEGHDEQCEFAVESMTLALHNALDSQIIVPVE